MTFLPTGECGQETAAPRDSRSAGDVSEGEGDIVLRTQVSSESPAGEDIQNAHKKNISCVLLSNSALIQKNSNLVTFDYHTRLNRCLTKVSDNIQKHKVYEINNGCSLCRGGSCSHSGECRP